MKRIACLFISVLVLLVITTVGFAQGTASRVTGTVLDQIGATVAGATVTLTNEATNVSLTTETTSSGTYVFDSVQVGIYTVVIEKPGFKKYISTGNAVNINQPSTVDVTLETGGVNETVTVQASAELVQSSSSGNFGNTVEERPLEALPIVGNRGRNPLEFINFQPGVVTGANTGGGVHVHGARDRAFNFTLDGIDINETSAGGSNFTPIRPNPDSLTQFQVITSNFTADTGRSSGAQVTLVTKSGGNEFHGNLFEFYQTPRFHANEYANTINTRLVNGQRVPTDRPQFVQHIFGGSVGGPVILPVFGEGGPSTWKGKNKTFFFTNLQELRTTQAFFVNRTVYTQQARAGLFRYAIGRANANALATGNARVIDDNGNPLFPNCSATVTSNCIASFSVVGNPNIPLTPDATTSALIGLTPLPNNFTVGDGLNTAGFSWVAPQNERQYDWTIKVDHNFNERNAMFVRYARGSQNTVCDNVNGGLQRFPGGECFVNTFRTPRNLAVNYRATLSPTVVNELVVGFNRFTFSFDNPDPNWATNSPVILNIPTDPLNSSPGINNARRITTYQIVDNLSWQRDAHTFKFGTNIRLQQHFDNRSSVAGFNTRESVTLGTGDNPVPSTFGTTATSAPVLPGATTANPNAGIQDADRTRLNSYINDIFGRVGRITQAFVAENDTTFAPAGTRFFYTAKYPEYDFYAQDTWKIRSNLTIDYGVRWEVRLSPRADEIILKPSVPVRFGEAPTNQISFEEGKLYDDSWKQFAPTAGFAWDPFKSGKTSIRGNYRLAWDRTNTFVFSSSIFQSAPGLTRGITRLANSFPGGQAAALLRNGLPTLSANDTTPLAFRTPPPFSVNSLTVVDPDMTYPRTHQWGVSFQREVGWSSVLEVSYIGRLGRKLYGAYDANQVDIFNNGFLTAFRELQGRAACDPVLLNPNQLVNRLMINDSRLNNVTTCGGVTRRETGAEFLIRQATGGNVRLANGTIATNIVNAGSAAQAAFLIAQGTRTGNLTTPNFQLNGFSPFFFQSFPQFSGAVNVLDNNDRSRYNALEVQLSRRFTRGIGFQISYTLSKSEDTRSYDPALTLLGRSAGGTAATFLSANTPFDIRNRDANWARSDFDRRHAVQGYFTAELPFGRGRRWAHDLNPVLDRIIGGFEIAGILRMYSGRPFTVYAGTGSVSQVVQSPASCNGCSPDMGRIILEGGRNFFFTADQRAMFFAPPAGELGNLGRNFFTGPSFFAADMTMAKRIRFDESRNLELRFEVQNLTNTPSFDFPTAVISNTNFGLVGGAVVSTSRKVQLAAKFHF